MILARVDPVWWHINHLLVGNFFIGHEISFQLGLSHAILYSSLESAKIVVVDRQSCRKKNEGLLGFPIDFKYILSIYFLV